MKKLAAFIPPAILAVIGVSIWAWGIISFVDSVRGHGFAVVAPGMTTVTITNAGDYTLWNQTKGIVDGQFKTFPEKLDPGMTIIATKLPEGTQVPMSTTMNSTVDINGTHRVSIGELSFASPGQYQIKVTGLADKHAFYLAEAKILRTISTMLVAGMAGLLFVVGSVIWGIFAFVGLFSKKK